MTDEQAWKKHLELDDTLRKAEIRFARAILNYEDNKIPGPVCMSYLAPLFKEIFLSRFEMKSVEQEYIENLNYLDSINFMP